MIVLSPHETREIVLDHDKNLPPEKQTVFILGPPRPSAAFAIEELLWSFAGELGEFFGWARDARAGAEDLALPGELMKKVPFQRIFRAVLPATIRNWRNLRDTKGQEVAWRSNAEGTGMDPDLLALFDMGTKTELYMHAWGLLQLTEEEAKN